MTHDEMVRELEATGSYRVLRKLAPRTNINTYDGDGNRTALFVDVETTGLDPAIDEIIALAMVPFSYSGDGRIYEIREPFYRLRQPLKPIPSAITAINGITDEMVAGAIIEHDEVAAFAANVAPVIAHNASFDRRFLERLNPIFCALPWACSQTQIPWNEEGFESMRLSSLAADCGFFYEKHQAIADCMAAIELLSRPLPRSGALALAKLLENGRKPTWRIWAAGAEFEMKDTLKGRGYQWHAAKKCWHIAVGEDAKDPEVEWLSQLVFRRACVPPMDRITAFDRFSEREIPA